MLRGTAGIAGGHDEGRQILQQNASHRGEAVGADAHELMHAGETAEDGPVADMDVARQLRVVGEDGLVADLAVVRQMDIGHDPVVITEAGYPGVLRRAAVEGAELADGVAIADFEAGRLAGVFLVLRLFADGTELENAVVAADPGMAADHHMGTDDGAVADLDMLADERIRTDGDVVAKPRRGMDDGGRMDAHADVERMAHIRSASAATSPSTFAVAANFHMPRLVVVSLTSITNWSPGPTGFLKRALSIPTK